MEDDRDWALEVDCEPSFADWNGNWLADRFDSKSHESSKFFYHQIQPFLNSMDTYIMIMQQDADQDLVFERRMVDGVMINDLYRDKCYGRGCNNEAYVILRLFWTTDFIFTSLCEDCYLAKGDICEVPGCTRKGIKTSWTTWEPCECKDPPIFVCTLHRMQFYEENAGGDDSAHRMWKWVKDMHDEVKRSRGEAQQLFVSVMEVLCKAKYQPIKNKRLI